MSRPSGIAGTSSGHSFARALDLHRAGQIAQAAEIYRALSSEGGPFAADARINLGAILDDLGQHEEALLNYRDALALREGNPLALNNMGNSLMKLGRFAEAAEAFQNAVQQAPDCQEARIGLGAALQREGDAAGAIASFREALVRDPACAEAHWNLALALLIAGEFREGWMEYQWRWRRDSFTSPRRAFKEPLWDGSPLKGRRILIHCEQGLGDTIQFMRYLPLVASAGGVVLAECQSPSLRPLLQRLPGVAEVFVMSEPLPSFDLQAPLLSLPHLFGTTLGDLPDQVPYLTADPARVGIWKRRLSPHDGVRVGIVWAGKPVPDPFRSSTIQAFAPLGQIPGVTLYSLQVGDRAGSSTSVQGPALIDLTPHIADFADTAALVSLLDLVISVDTSVAHLAGALGKPVWLLLPKAGDYRWLLEREDSPWYPTMRVFRQERQGEWASVMERVSGELKEVAWRHLEEASARDPFNGWRIYQCGIFLAEQGKHREATVRFTKSAQLLRSDWEPHYSLAISLQQLGRIGEARESLQNAVAIRGDLAMLHEALGIIRQMQGDLRAATSSYEQALKLDPDLVKAGYNLATAYRETGRFDEAIALFRRVITLAPGHADAHWNLAVLLLLKGDFTEGWREFGWRFSKTGLAPARRWQDVPRWDGSPLAGRTILLYAEQGLGDTLHFVRYAPMVAARGGRVVVEVQSKSLASLIRRVAGVSDVVVFGEEPPAFDCQASLLDLPQIFATDVAAIPAEVPYLVTDAASTGKAAKLIPRDGSFRVGIVWGGNPGHTNDANRSIPLERLTPLAQVPGVTFYSLQLREREGEAELMSRLGFRDLSQAIDDFSDTAAFAAELDLVITVDTSVAHLCGGVGLSVWVLIPFIPDWRWLVGRDDSPWYPTMRLFRQAAAGDWDGVILQVREALMAVSSRTGEGSAELHKTRGLALSGQGRFPEAIEEFHRALQGDASDCDLLNNLGCALAGAGRHEEAVQAYRQVISLSPDFMVPHYNMGNSLKVLGRPAEAIEAFSRALALDPKLPQGWHNLALSLQDAGRHDEARAALERAISISPGYLEARHNLGELYHLLGDLDAAMVCFKEVINRDPRYIPSWNALGIALQVQYKLEEAAECYLKALSLDPDYLHALNNLGSVSKGLGLLDRAVACYQRVLTIDPEYADARWNLSLVQLLLGQYEEGWKGYEWRFRKVDPIPRKSFPQPLWDGRPLEGRVILLHSEQGFGDTVQFVRYATAVARMGGVVLVECQSEAIAPVVATVPGVTRVLVRGEALPQFDVHAPLMSLPHLCGTSLATIPAETPYVSADPLLADQWRARLQGKSFRVGIVWAGRKSYKDDGKRSLDLGLFAPLARVRGIRLYSLQVGEGSEQAATPPAGMEIIHLGDGIRTFADTAAIIENLDLVISADTAVAHLTGALGKPVWVLLPTACDWRWLLGREDSPWYPGARLFRQKRRGEWAEVLERVAQALEALST